MMPGMGRMNPRQMKKILKRQGIDIDELDGVVEVVIRLPDRAIVFDSPMVTVMRVQGQTTYQVVGEPKEVAAAEAPAGGAPPEEEYPDVDVQLVMDNTDATREEAIEALRATGGNPADAIIRLSESG